MEILTLQRISVEDLLNIVEELYEGGLDYIDIKVDKEDNGDYSIEMGYVDEYFCEEAQKELLKITPTVTIKSLEDLS